MHVTIQINWLLLVSNFLWILGIAIIIALLGLMQFLKASNGIKCIDTLKKPLLRIGILFSFGMIISGLLLNYFKIPSDKFIAAKIEKQIANPMEWRKFEGLIHFFPNELKMDRHNKGHLMNNEGMKDDTLILFWDGYIQTPFIRFKTGKYCVEFMAKGSRARNEFSKIKIEFETPDDNNYLMTRKGIYIELNSKMKTYSMNFKTETDTIGRIRITYFNDLHIPEAKEGRDVWMKNLVIKRL